jgi:hypothetical protein
MRNLLPRMRSAGASGGRVAAAWLVAGSILHARSDGGECRSYVWDARKLDIRFKADAGRRTNPLRGIGTVDERLEARLLCVN